MLFVIGAQPAIERAAGLGPGLGAQRTVAGLEPVLLRAPIGKIVADQRLLHAMRAAAFEVEDAIVLDDDLGRDGLEASLAQARGLAVEDIGRRLTVGRGKDGCVRERSRGEHRR